jgi:hypothetical protein
MPIDWSYALAERAADELVARDVGTAI